MRGLKTLVVVMGVMLVAGVVVLAAAIGSRLPKESLPVQAFTAPPIEIPPGAHIESMTAGADRLVVDLALGDGTRQLVVIDLSSGKKLGTIPLRAAP